MASLEQKNFLEVSHNKYMKNDLNDIVRRIEELEKTVFENKNYQRKFKKNFNFSINERAFVKRYLSDKSGPKKFTGLLAYLVEGDINKDIELNVIKIRWEKMGAKSLLGKFNMFYPNDAKTRGWIDSKKFGLYHLTDEWQEIV